MQKKYIIIAGLVCLFILLCTATGVIAFNIGRTNTGNNQGTTGNTDSQRQLLDRIGEYERREQDRITAENRRVEAERERIKRTEDAIRALRESDRRSSTLLQELATEVDILANYFRDSRNEFNNYVNNMGSN